MTYNLLMPPIITEAGVFSSWDAYDLHVGRSLSKCRPAFCTENIHLRSEPRNETCDCGVMRMIEKPSTECLE